MKGLLRPQRLGPVIERLSRGGRSLHPRL